MQKNYLSSLNEAQREAVVTVDGPVLIVAGAGAGKTKTITHRILHLMKQGIAPEKILAITFTNKAAKEMKERIAQFAHSEPDVAEIMKRGGAPFVSTFHALGVFLLKQYGEKLGLSRHFTIFDKNDQKSALKDALIAAQYDPKQFDPAKVGHAISRAKGEGETVREYEAKVGNAFFEQVVAKAWLKYEEILKKEHALDFDDLLQKSLILLTTFPDVRAAVQNRFSYVHIDEYQDTNKVQDKIASIICELHKNICVVGDTDQNIYSWRGAQIHNMLNFERAYPSVKIIRLEENYRSTKTILAVANAVIAKNKYRIEKNLFTNNVDGEKVVLIENYDEASEAQTVASTIRQLIANGTPADEIAILYRANFQSRVLEEACVRESIPYHMIGTKFFERKEIKDVLAYIRAALNPANLTDIRRTINTPARGIGKVTVEKFLAGKEEELPAATRAKIESYRTTLRLIAEENKTRVASELIKYVLERTGIVSELEMKKHEEDTERLENIEELVTMALQYDHYGASEGIDRMLTDSALSTDEESEEAGEKQIRLMTVHSAKGLEFDVVFITGLEENLFPHRRHDTNKKAEDEEEERRLFYVAVTRARKRLYLSYAQMRTIFGQRQVNIPSEFIFDVADEYIERLSGQESEAPRKPLFKIDF